MLPDLERLIALQKLDTTADAARRTLAEEPERERAFAARLDEASQRVAAAKAQLAENQNARRGIEKDVAVHQGRLSKFREQAMAVKTNIEYHAIQKEISFAQTEINRERLRTELKHFPESAAGEDGWSALGAVGQQIGNQASFDPRNYGYRKLIDLMEATQLFELDRRGSQVVLRDKRLAKSRG